jgi:TRAP-type C4-dicarboxylate transport system substrate-binding protein
VLLISEKKLAALPADLQRTVLEAAAQAAAFERRRDAELNAEAVTRMQARGAQIVMPDRAKFAARIAPIQDEVARSLNMSDVLELIRAHAR